MKAAVALLLAVALASPLAATAVRLQSKVTPTQKVVQMLTEMQAKGEKMMDDEQKIFAKYAEWADDKTKELGFEIRTATAKIEELVAFVAKADSDVEQLGLAIEELDKEIRQLETEKKEAAAAREAERAEYAKVSTDYAESVDALGRAIQVMQSQNYDRAQAESLLQRMATTAVPGVPGVLSAFLQQQQQQQQQQQKGQAAQPGAPEVASYEFQSSGIVEMLEGLLRKFRDQLGEVDEAETNQAHAFELQALHLTDAIAKSTSDREEKSATKAKKAAASAQAKGELAETKADKAADEELKAETEAMYKSKAMAYEANQKVRKEELEAIAKAAEIISGEAVSGGYSRRIHAELVQRAPPSARRALRGAPGAFIQMRSSTRRVATKEQAAMLLRRRAKALKSKTLAALAEQVPANAFAKVIGMVEELIAKLKEEAAAEADHKAWCDEQLKANKLKRNKKTAQAEKLAAEIEAQTGAIDTLAEDIETLVKEQAELTKAMEEATALRAEEKAENAAVVQDAAAGKEAVQNALVILKEFYSAHAGAFVQQAQAPEMAAYRGMQGGKGGVIGMLEVVASDFARLKAETEATEATAAREYEAFADESLASKEQKHKSEVRKSLEKDKVEFEKSQSAKNLKAVSKELAKANKYYEYLTPSCLEVHVSWEERVARRKEEIQALKDAYAILDQKSAE